MRRVFLFVLAVILTGIVTALFVIALSVSARAHTEAEQRTWERDWATRVRATGLTLGLLDEYRDFQSRHAPRPVQSTPIQSASVTRGIGSNVEQWRSLVSGYDWDVDTALCLMAKESGGNPSAQNASSGASGLMQVLPSWADDFSYAPADLFDPGVNLDISYALYVDGGWGHWSPWLRGECR